MIVTMLVNRFLHESIGSQMIHSLQVHLKLIVNSPKFDRWGLGVPFGCKVNIPHVRQILPPRYMMLTMIVNRFLHESMGSEVIHSP